MRNKSPIFLGILVVLLCSLMGAQGRRTGTTTTSAPAKEDKPWQIIRDKEFTLGVPRGWRKIDMVLSRVHRLYMNGDGIGAPLMDETRAPIQIGMAVERYANQKVTAVEGAKQNLKVLQLNRRLKPVAPGTVKEFRLADGTDAAYLSVELIKGSSRRSFYQKVFAVDKNSTGWVVLGWIVCGKESEFLKKNPQLIAMLEAHLKSLSFAKDKFSEENLKQVYERKHPSTQPTTSMPSTTKPAGTK